MQQVEKIILRCQFMSSSHTLSKNNQSVMLGFAVRSGCARHERAGMGCQGVPRCQGHCPPNLQPLHSPHLCCQPPDAAHNAVQVLAPSRSCRWKRQRSCC